jgi:branched-chain amino acid transport system substrate-binding protein
MRQAGVKAFWTTSADAKTMARVVKAMDQQGFKPAFIALGASGYDPAFLALSGGASEGVYVDQQLALYQGGDSTAVPEVRLFNEWLQKVKPGYVPDLFAAFAWASGRLLQQSLEAAGPQLTRKGLLSALKKIDRFDANGMMAESGPASKRQPTCDMFMRVQAGKFVRLDPPGKGFICGGTIFTK